MTEMEGPPCPSPQNFAKIPDVLAFLKKDPVRLGVILLALSSLISRALGLLRDLVFSSIFGVGTQAGPLALDAYFVAFKIPDFLYTLLIFGAMSASFIPLYTQLRKKEGQDKAFEFTSQVLTGLMGLLLFCSLLGWLTAPYLIPHLASGFDPQLQSLAVTLTRIMLLSPIFMGLSSILQGVENANKRFYGTALAPVFYNLSIILAALIFGRTHGVYALAYGVAAGAFLHFLIQIPGVYASAYRYRFHFKWKDKAWREFLALSVPRLLGISSIQLASIADVFLTSFLSVGSLSVYNYAFNLQSLPYGVVALAVSTAVYSSLAEQVDEPQQFINSLRQSLSQILFWVLPAVLGLYLLREPLIELLLERGAFDAEATQRTAETLKIFVWTALPLSFIPLFTRAFYAFKKTFFPASVACVSMAGIILFNSLGIFVYGGDLKTLALGNVLGTTLNALLLVLGLAQHFKRSPLHFLDAKKLSIQITSLAVMIAVLMQSESLPLLLQISLAAATYLGLALLLNTALQKKIRT
ncbi:murein biosynthesis integral membrane protein MurJ [Candidatus Peregrinibacteria bacterium]|nr:MAG: murein biosynthesis integral membrane protein MurJ [Candidatus Peregrinibacteria bacterium]